MRDADSRGFLTFDLRDVLACLGSDAIERTWRCEGVDCSGEGSDEMFDVEYRRLNVPGRKLIDLSHRILRIIDGTFYGRRPGENVPSIVVRSVDGTSWQVFANDKCLRKIESGFTDVRPARSDAGSPR